MTGKGAHKLISPFSVVLIMVALSVLGVASIPRLNIQYMPKSTGRIIQVSYYLQDASAEYIEAETTSRLEGILSGIKGRTDISSVSRKGSGQITLEFRKGTDMEAARFEVASAVRNIYSSLPQGLSYPYIQVESGESRQHVGYTIAYNLKASIPPKEIDAFAREHLLPALSSIKGVDGVDLSGSTPFRWVITFDVLKVASLDINGTDIEQAFRNSYSDVVLGMADVGEGRLAVRLSGPNPPDFATIPVKNVGGTVYYLRDIAIWHYEESPPESYYRVNGLNTILIGVTAADSENMLKTVSAVKKEMERLQSSFPSGITATLAYDASEYVRSELKKVLLRTGLCVLLLLLFVLLISRSWRYFGVITATLAVNVFTAVAIYAFAGIAIHIYTLAGITVSLGIVIDTSIVMADHYGRWKDRKAFSAVLSATVTTAVALMMVLFLPEGARENLTDFIWVIVINLSLSLAVTYFFIPSLMGYLPRGGPTLSVSGIGSRWVARFNAWYRRYLSWGLSHKRILLILFIAAFGIPTCLLPESPSGQQDGPTSTGVRRMLERLSSWEPYALNRDRVDQWLGSSFGLFYKALDRSNFYRSPERKRLYIRAGMPEGASVAQLNEVVKSMENYLAGFDEIETFTTSVYRYDNATLVVEFKPEYENTFFPSQLKAQVSVMAANYGGANWVVFGIDQNYFNNHVARFHKSYGVTLRGYNYHELRRFGEELCTYLSANNRVKGPEIWGSDRFSRPETEFNLTYDFEAMTSMGVNPYAYYGLLSSHLYEREIGNVLLGGQYSNVVMRSSEVGTFDLWHVLHAPVQVDSTAVTLSEVGTISKKPTGLDIRKDNQSYRLDVCFDFAGSYTLAQKLIAAAVNHMNANVLPVGYKAEGGSEGWYGLQKSDYSWLIILIVAVIFVLLAMFLESLRYPLAVIMMIPISFIGVFLIFGLSRLFFDQGGFAALVMLCGIVVNAGIYLITTFQQLGGQGGASKEERLRLYVKAFNQKIIPISLTLASTILGLLPFLSDGPEEVFWFNFAIGTIGGLVFSIVALLLYMPVFIIKR